MDISAEQIGLLIELGSMGDCMSQAAKGILASTELLGNIHTFYWGDQNLVCLAKGIVVADSTFGWNGGSCAVEILIYGKIQQRKLDPDFKLGDWMMNNTSNPYVPYGGFKYRPKSIEEYNQHYAAVFERNFQG
jgi:hypothetical protein